MIQWVKERFKNLPFYLIVIGGLTLFSVRFLQRTEKNVNNAERIENNTYGKEVTINVLPMGCAHFGIGKPKITK